MAKLPKAFETFRRRYRSVYEAYEALGGATHEAGPLDQKTRELVKRGGRLHVGRGSARSRETRKSQGSLNAADTRRVMATAAQYGIRDGDLADTPLSERSFDDLLEEAIGFHGHLCPGQVLGIRMAVAGCRQIGIDRPRRAGKGLGGNLRQHRHGRSRARGGARRRPRASGGICPWRLRPSKGSDRRLSGNARGRAPASGASGHPPGVAGSEARPRLLPALWRGSELRAGGCLQRVHPLPGLLRWRLLCATRRP